jgi:hypothetical protein
VFGDDQQTDALLDELRDPALARQFLMDSDLIDADGQLTVPSCRGVGASRVLSWVKAESGFQPKGQVVAGAETANGMAV